MPSRQLSEGSISEGNDLSRVRDEVAIAAAIGVVIALLTSWPLAARMSTSLPESGPAGIGDPYILAWQIAWEGHALRAAPSELLEANYFFPLEDSLAFLDPVHGFAPLAVLGSGPEAAVFRYNLLFLLAYVLAFVGPFLLCRELGLSSIAAALAGAAFAYAPWRLYQLGHLLVISSGGIPLALFMLIRGYRRARSGWVMAGWLTATWQLSLGYTLGLQFSYLLAGLGVIFLMRWLLIRPREIDHKLFVTSAIGIAIFLGWGLLQAQPALDVAERHPEAIRSDGDVAFFSPPPRSFQAAPPNNLLWGERSAPARTDLSYALEQSLFPGLAIVSLAITGFIYLQPLAAKLGMALGVLLFGYLSMGLSAPDGGQLYRALLSYAPGWRGIRTPGRLMTVVSLFLAVLAAFGLQVVYLSLRDRFRAGRLRWIPAAVAVAICLFVVIEGWGPVKVLPTAPVPASQTRAEPPIAHIPMDGGSESLYMYWSTDGFAPMVNGAAAFVPHKYAEIAGMVGAFPSQDSVDYLRGLGVRSVVVHLSLLSGGTEWESRAGPIATSLGLRGQRIGNDLIYPLGP